MRVFRREEQATGFPLECCSTPDDQNLWFTSFLHAKVARPIIILDK